MAPSRYYRNYLRTYVERDVRAMVNIIMDAVKWYKNRDDDAQFHFLRTQTGRLLPSVELIVLKNHVYLFNRHRPRILLKM